MSCNLLSLSQQLSCNKSIWCRGYTNTSFNTKNTFDTICQKRFFVEFWVYVDNQYMIKIPVYPFVLYLLIIHIISERSIRRIFKTNTRYDNIFANQPLHIFWQSMFFLVHQIVKRYNFWHECCHRHNDIQILTGIWQNDSRNLISLRNDFKVRIMQEWPDLNLDLR